MTAHPVLDPTALENLRGLSPDDDGAFVRELIELFLEDSPSHREKVLAGCAAGDAPKVATSAHTIKGSAGNFGAVRLAAISLQIELLAKAGSLAEVSPLLPQFEHEFAAVHRALKEELARLG